MKFWITILVVVIGELGLMWGCFEVIKYALLNW